MQKSILKETNALQEKTLEDFLSQKEPINKNILNELEKLYGEEYKNFTKVQKAYLEKNLNNFQVITQRVLDRMGYPELAAKQKIGGINTVEFIFYPNGDISDLRIINSSGYSVLDKHSIELIEIAYKDYPKPTEPIKIRFRVFYRAY
ncbi:TonB family domain protein [Aliarcobacter butzleri JV22]|nr:energy transducer TonB [Aliarcobacter butzleri]EFU69506.1 TonB family domain protein [Aliarcobacter butzleri JV22]